MMFKCKMCGGELNIEKNIDICICPYCKTKQTIPNTDDEKAKQLHDRANYYRLSNEFDRAITIYEQILEKNSKDPEAYWGVLLCRYGVEYVEDNHTKKRIPTCHRTCYDSILEDINYKAVLKYACPEKATQIHLGNVYESEVELYEWPLSHQEIADASTIVYKNLKSPYVDLMMPEYNLRMSIEGYPFFAIWSSDMTAPFICLEPWYGHADFEPSDCAFEDREGMMQLSPNKSFMTSYWFEINE